MTILVVGGLNGFVGSNTTEALVNLGKDCVVTSHKNTEIPGFLQKHIAHHRVMVEHADATSIDDLRKIGERHPIESIVNVGGGFRVGPKTPTSGFEGYFDMLLAVFKLAQEWKVKRVTFSSTGGMYMGMTGQATETVPISLQSPFPRGGSILQYQKIVEVVSSDFQNATGISTICVRLIGMFGPFQDVSQSFANVPLTLVHAALAGKTANLTQTIFGYADDAVDLLYIKDLARAIALVHAADKLQYNVYNIASGKDTTTKDVVQAVEKAVPGFHVELPPGKFPFPALPAMDTTRLQTDTGFTPKYDIQSAIQDYVSWLKAGNSK